MTIDVGGTVGGDPVGRKSDGSLVRQDLSPAVFLILKGSAIFERFISRRPDVQTSRHPDIQMLSWILTIVSAAMTVPSTVTVDHARYRLVSFG